MNNFIEKLKRPKNYIPLIIAILIFSYLIFKPNPNQLKAIETDTATIGNIQRIVGETGIVEASKEVTLSFDTTGIVNQIYVNEGDSVSSGTKLMDLQAEKLDADYSGAIANVQAQQALLNELQTGIRDIDKLSAETQVIQAQTALRQAEESLIQTTSEHNLLVEQSKTNIYTTDIQAYLTDGGRTDTNYNFSAPTVSGSYQDLQSGEYNFELYPSASSSGYSIRYTGLETGNAPVSSSGPVALGNKGLYLQFPSNFAVASNIKWTIPIPNHRSNQYTFLLNSLDTAEKNRESAILQANQNLQTAQRNLQQATANLTQTSAPNRQEQIAAQQASVRQAQASAQSIQAVRNQTVIYAPFDGTITDVSLNRGERVIPGTAVISMISNENLEVSVNIAEADIQDITIGDVANISFDAYRDELYKANVIYIAPIATTSENVTSFKTTLQFQEQNPKIKAGLTANIDIIADEAENVLTVPIRSVFQDENGNSIVRIIQDDKIYRKQVETGIRGSDGRIEIKSGLIEGETVITFLNDTTRKFVEDNELK